MLTEERRNQFTSEVARLKLKTDQSRGGGPVRLAGLLMMTVGVVGAFVAYNSSLSQSDLRDLGSLQILATAFVAIVVTGAAFYLAGAVARVLRLWLLRQLVEGQAHIDQLVGAIENRKI